MESGCRCSNNDGRGRLRQLKTWVTAGEVTTVSVADVLHRLCILAGGALGPVTHIVLRGAADEERVLVNDRRHKLDLRTLLGGAPSSRLPFARRGSSSSSCGFRFRPTTPRRAGSRLRVSDSRRSLRALRLTRHAPETINRQRSTSKQA